jgi:uncharacterized membrane protein YecN with MAPEG domain
MTIPITLGAAGLLGLIYAALTCRVFVARYRSRIMLGDGTGPGDEKLLIAVRTHANFAEYVPLILLLLGAAELQHASRPLLIALASALILGRLLHPIGMALPAPNLFRAGGATLTLAVLVIASLTAVALAL